MRQPQIWKAKDGSGTIEQYEDHYFINSSSGRYKFAGKFSVDDEWELQVIRPKVKMVDKGTHYATEPIDDFLAKHEAMHEEFSKWQSDRGRGRRS